MITIVYLLICWLSSGISVDYPILFATVALDFAWIFAGLIYNDRRNKK